MKVVLNSDTERLKLMNELEELKAKLETSNDQETLDRYNEVRSIFKYFPDFNRDTGIRRSG